MRIKEIIIEGLYDTFNHTIPLNQEENITIIHAPNGFGKTVILKMLYGLLNSQLSIFRKIPFDKFKIVFDNRNHLEVEQFKKELFKGATNYEFEISYFENGEKNIKKKKFNSKQVSKEINFPLGMIERIIPELDRTSDDVWFDISTKEKLTIEDILDKYYESFPSKILDINDKIISMPDWLKEIRKNINIYFIQTQRLLLQTSDKETYSNSKASLVNTASKYSDELIKTIKSKLSEYASISQDLDREFPKRLVLAKFNKLSADQIEEKLTFFEKKRRQLKENGLLDEAEDIDLRFAEDIQEDSISPLSLYIQDTEKKLSVFDDLTQKIDLFRNIINKRFLYKNITISKEQGFVFSTDKGDILSSNDLSSGEQHELVLLYEMLFKVKSNSLILIDEPEISLHIVWQEQFLADLQEIIKLRGFDVLLATHSPQIISDRWDLTVELKGKEEIETISQ